MPLRANHSAVCVLLGCESKKARRCCDGCSRLVRAYTLGRVTRRVRPRLLWPRLALVTLEVDQER